MDRRSQRPELAPPCLTAASLGNPVAEEERVDEDEPLEQWAARREERRRPVGRLKAVTIGHADAPAHRHQHLPRLVSGWDGYPWVPETIAENFAAAQRILHSIEGDGVIPMPPAPPRTKRVGKHRKP